MTPAPDSAAPLEARGPTLPRGRHALAPTVVRASQRRRLLLGVGWAAAEKGYANVSVEDITKAAGVSRKTFYENFSDKLDCFLTAYERSTSILLERVRAAATAAEDPWFDKVAAAVRAYLEWLQRDTRLAKSFLVEAIAAGPEAAKRRAAVHAEFVDLYRDLYDADRKKNPKLPKPPDFALVAFIAGANELVYNRLGESSDLLSLEPELLTLARALIVGEATRDSPLRS